MYLDRCQIIEVTWQANQFYNLKVFLFSVQALFKSYPKNKYFKVELIQIMFCITKDNNLP